MVRASVRGSGDAGSNPVRNKLVFSKNFCCSEKIITLEYARMCLQVKKIRVAIRSPMAQPAVPSPGSGRTKKTRVQSPQGAGAFLSYKTNLNARVRLPGD